MVLALQCLVALSSGAIAILLALLTLASGPEWALLGAATSATAVGLVALAAFLWWLRTRLGQQADSSRALLMTLEGALVVLGAGIYLRLMSYQPGSPGTPGTDGPFADGGYGAIVLLSEALFGGGAVVVLVLIYDSLRRALDRPG